MRSQTEINNCARLLVSYHLIIYFQLSVFSIIAYELWQIMKLTTRKTLNVYRCRTGFSLSSDQPKRVIIHCTDALNVLLASIKRNCHALTLPV